MEVFAGLYNNSLEELLKPFTMVVVSNSFADLLETNKIIFCGNGSQKLQNVLCHPNAIFSDARADASNLVNLSSTYFYQKKFVDVAYIEPLYVKEFYSTAR
jgi:tRNA threonylcarbamoyladenosine biosynthesis protein TsaB